MKLKTWWVPYSASCSRFRLMIQESDWARPPPPGGLGTPLAHIISPLWDSIHVFMAKFNLSKLTAHYVNKQIITVDKTWLYIYIIHIYIYFHLSIYLFVNLFIYIYNIIYNIYNIYNILYICMYVSCIYILTHISVSSISEFTSHAHPYESSPRPPLPFPHVYIMCYIRIED